MDFSQYLDFEKPIVELEREVIRLKGLIESGNLGLAAELEKVEKKLVKSRSDIYGNLTAYQKVRLSRHFERPQTLDYIGYLVKDFVELHGDRNYSDDQAIVSGIGEFNGKPILVVGHQRGKGTTQDRIKRNFGMPQPDGYRKACRMYKLAEKFNIPLLLLIDTQGAFPGLEAEERGQAEAIARCLYILANLKTRIVSVVIGEGGSGGALALGICDKLLMFENSTYSVITPEGCASILWGKTESENLGEFVKVAAESLKLSAKSLDELGLVDEVIKEPPGAAHRDPELAAENLGKALTKYFNQLDKKNIKEILDERYKKYRSIGLTN